MKKAALFDMDRTLLRVNTAPKYILWRFSRGEASMIELIQYFYWTLQYKFGVANAEKISQKALMALKGVKEEVFRNDLLSWYETDVSNYVTEDGRKEVRLAKEQGFELAILSASMPFVVQPLADELGIEHVICTTLEIQQDALTGRLIKPMCYGKGKIELAERWASEHDIDLDQSRFYTDSVSDVPMLERVGEPRVINPDFRLHMLAKKKKWPITFWK